MKSKPRSTLIELAFPMLCFAICPNPVNVNVMSCCVYSSKLPPAFFFCFDMHQTGLPSSIFNGREQQRGGDLLCSAPLKSLLASHRIPSDLAQKSMWLHMGSSWILGPTSIRSLDGWVDVRGVVWCGVKMHVNIPEAIALLPRIISSLLCQLQTMFKQSSIK
jgi:hypothetical protein